MSKEKNLKLENEIREIVDEAFKNISLVNEQEDYGSSSDTLGGIYGDYMDSMGPGGGGGGSSGGAKGALSQLAGILPIGVVPQVANTIAWGIQNMTRRVYSLLKTLVNYMGSVLLPGFNAINNYKKIRKEEIRDLSNIDKKFASTLQANMAVLHDLDAWGLVFLLDPSLGLGWRLLEKGIPTVAATLSSSLLGVGARDAYEKYVGRTKTRWSRRDKQWTQLFKAAGFEDADTFVTEQQQPEPTDNYKEVSPEEFLKGFLKSKEYQQAVKQSGIANKVAVFAENAILDRVRNVLAAKTLEEVAQNNPELSQAVAQVTAKIAEEAQKLQMNQEDIEKSRQAALNKLKEDFKKNAVDNLTKQSAANPSSAAKVTAIIQQIQQMK